MTTKRCYHPLPNRYNAPLTAEAPLSFLLFDGIFLSLPPACNLLGQLLRRAAVAHDTHGGLGSLPPGRLLLAQPAKPVSQSLTSSSRPPDVSTHLVRSSSGVLKASISPCLSCSGRFYRHRSWQAVGTVSAHFSRQFNSFRHGRRYVVLGALAELLPPCGSQAVQLCLNPCRRHALCTRMMDAFKSRTDQWTSHHVVPFAGGCAVDSALPSCRAFGRVVWLMASRSDPG